MLGTMTYSGGVGTKCREIPTFSVKYKDVFSLQNLYVMMHEMLLEEDWNGFGDTENHTALETLYSENVYQKGIHAGGKEMDGRDITGIIVAICYYDYRIFCPYQTNNNRNCCL